MIVNNVRVVPRNRLPFAAPTGFMHTSETYHHMMEKTEPHLCLIFDVTVEKGDMKPLATEKFVHEFMAKNFPETVYHLERHLDAFGSMLFKFEEYGKAFVYYYCYSEDREAITKLEQFARSKLFMTKVKKYLIENEK